MRPCPELLGLIRGMVRARGAVVHLSCIHSSEPRLRTSILNLNSMTKHTEKDFDQVKATSNIVEDARHRLTSGLYPHHRDSFEHCAQEGQA